MVKWPGVCFLFPLACGVASSAKYFVEQKVSDEEVKMDNHKYTTND
jgi:hypothetical protein